VRLQHETEALGLKGADTLGCRRFRNISLTYMAALPSKKQSSVPERSAHAEAVTSSLAWLHGSSICSGIFITPNRMLCPRCVCSSWQAASSLVIKRRHTTDNTVLSITCDPGDCFLANNALDIVIIGVSAKFSQAAGITPISIAWPEPAKSSLASRVPVNPPLGAGYRLHRWI